MKKTRRFASWFVWLILGTLVCTAAPLQAATAYDVSGVTFSQTVTTTQFVRVTEDLTVSWTKPTGTDPILNYFLKINSSSTPLTGTALDDVTYDFKTTSGELFRIIPKATFDNYDSNQLRYLHIRTQYLDSASGNVAYSDDVVSAAIRIDNVAPTGKLTLDPTSGSTKQINVTMSPSESIRYYWLNDASTFPAVAGTDYSAYPQGTVGLRDGTAYGDVTISAWFEDFAGNRTTAASASAVYKYTAPVAIQYNASSLNVDATLGFTVDSTTTYNWTITDASVSGVAEFSGASTGVASVTVVGKKAGTFTVTATPTPTSGSPLKTGTITVVQSTVSKTFSLATTAKTNVNTIGFVLENTGITTAHELGTAVGNCDLVSRWDEATQSYSSHPMAAPTFNNFPLVVGKAYFVSVTAAHDFTLTGSLPTSKTVNLVTTAKTNVNAIGIPNSKGTLTTAHLLGQNIGNVDLVSRWDVATQSYSSHPMAAPTFNNFAIEWGYGYFVSVTSDTPWNW